MVLVGDHCQLGPVIMQLGIHRELRNDADVLGSSEIGILVYSTLKGISPSAGVRGRDCKRTSAAANLERVQCIKE